MFKLGNLYSIKLHEIVVEESVVFGINISLDAGILGLLSILVGLLSILVIVVLFVLGGIREENKEEKSRFLREKIEEEKEEKSRKNKLDNHERNIHMCLKNHSYSDALSECEDAIKTTKEQPEYALFKRYEAYCYYHLARENNKEKNTRKAICACKQALNFFKVEKEKYPSDYARTQRNLGIAYKSLADVRNKGENLNKAIYALEEAKKIFNDILDKKPKIKTVGRDFTNDDPAMCYAQAQQDLGYSYWDLSEVGKYLLNWNEIPGNDSEIFKDFLKSNCRHLISDIDWVKTAEIKRTDDSITITASNVEKRPSLTLIKENTKLNLKFDNDRIHELDVEEENGKLKIGIGKKEILKMAINAFNEALIIRTSKKNPSSHAKTKNGLGKAYRALSEVENESQDLSEAKRNLEEAIAIFKQALEIRTVEKSPFGHAETMDDLGKAYLALSKVLTKEKNVNEAEKNVNEAIKAFEAALKIFVVERYPIYCALAQHNLAVAYRRLAEIKEKEGEKEENLNKAIKIFNEALKIRTITNYPIDYARTQHCLGIAYMNRAKVKDKKENLNKAIKAFEEALKIRTITNYPDEYNKTLKYLVRGCLKILCHDLESLIRANRLTIK